jgi:plastocyanin
MPRRAIAALGLSAVLALAGCGLESGAGPSPTATGPGASVPGGGTPTVAPSASVAGSAIASVVPSGPTGPCSPTDQRGGLVVTIREFFFNPATIRAAVGQVIRFTNQGSIDHTATLADGTCSTSVLGPDDVEGLVFSAAGTYPFRCDIHRSMLGTITIG